MVSRKIYQEMHQKLYDSDIQSTYENMLSVDNTISTGYTKRISFGNGLEILIMRNHTFETTIDLRDLSTDDAIEINYCWQGEVYMELRQADECLNLRKGQICLNRLTNSVTNFYKKSNLYTGISLFIQKDQLSNIVLGLCPPDINDNFQLFINKIIYENTCTLLAGNITIDTLAGEIINMNFPPSDVFQQIHYKKLVTAISSEIWEVITTPRSSSYNSPQIEIAKTFLFDNLQKPPSLERLAKLANISTTTLKTGFKAQYNETVYGLLRKERLRKAKLLLTDGKSVTETAVAVGYANPSQFSKAFKAQWGITPSEYKNQLP